MSADPEAVAARLRGRGPLVWLDGGLDADGLGRHSFFGSAPVGAVFAWDRRILHLDARGRRRREVGDPLAALAARVAELPATPPDDGRPFRAAAMGWLGYELGRTVERIPAPADDASLVPDLAFWLFDDVLAHDRERGEWLGGSDEQRRAVAAARPLVAAGPARAATPRSNFTRDGYLAAVERAREHIRDGDAYQVNLSQRFTGRLDEPPFDLYRRLRSRRPAPLGAYIEAGSRAVLSNSPELFLSVRGRAVETRPIKGTRPRGATPAEDARLAAELEASPKERAELTMIVDLLRNDLGRVAATGSVTVPSLARRVELPTVHHLVATVTATLRDGVGPAELLGATFPGGSVTGCPKIRAMEIISALEPCRRGVYCGAIGWIAPGGDLTLSVAIRTLTAARGRYSLHSGGGIVLDSDPAAEHEETLAKARAFLEALGAA